MPLTPSAYTPHLWFRNGHLSTIYSAVFRNVRNPGQQRERLVLSDGDFLDLDWTRGAMPARRVVVLLHGLEGNAQRPYMLGSVRIFSEAGFDVCAVNLRGCSGEPNRLYRSYHSGATEDLNEVLLHLDRNYAYDQVFLKGFSLGGNLVLKYLGESPAMASKVRAAITISVPCDLHDSLRQLNLPENRLYARRFLVNLRGKLRAKQKLFPEQITDQMIEAVRSLKDFDDLYTSRAHGFADALDYYRKCSCLPLLGEIKVPTLLINAENDSFLGPDCYPAKAGGENPHLYFERPAHGGHVGFVQPGGFYYNEVRAIQFAGEHS